MSQCLKPLLIINPHYLKLCNGSRKMAWRSFSARRDFRIVVDCGKCLHCLRRRASGWRLRLLDEYSYLDPVAKSRCIFCTFTVAPDFYSEFEKAPNVFFRRFLDRCRKRLGKSPRHWFVTERGEQRDRLHLHGILFDCPLSFDELESLWSYGFISVSVLESGAGISYVTKYITKFCGDWFIDEFHKQKVFCSPGIGKAYCSDPSNIRWHGMDGDLRPFVINAAGYMVGLPRYYRSKLFSESDLLELHSRWLDSVGELPTSGFVGKRQFNSFESLKFAVESVGGSLVLNDVQYDKYLDLYHGKK